MRAFVRGLFLSAGAAWRWLVVFTVVIWSVGLTFLVPGFLSDYAYGVSLTWDGGGDGSDWSDATNWNPDQVPTSSDSVTIDTAATVVSSAAISYSDLTIGDGAGSVTSTLQLGHSITSGGNITVRNGGVLEQTDSANKTITGSITVQSGGYLTHSDNSTTEVSKIDITATGLTVDSGGYIYLKALGYDGGAGTNPAGDGSGPGGGDGGTTIGGGGAHGGNGGVSMYRSTVTNAGGSGYGSITAPITLGSGGGGAISNAGGDGGGAAKITISGSGTATINGIVIADGELGE